MRILFDKNVPYPLLRYLAKHDVRTAVTSKQDKAIAAARYRAVVNARKEKR